MRSAASDPVRVLVDQTHCGRHVTGLERITLELFSAAALAPLNVVPVTASSRAAMMAKQSFGLPWSLLLDRKAVVLCPGFPPSPLLTILGGDRVVPYIHDLFLLTRPQDLNLRAKLYMVVPFRLIVARSKLFLVNSQYTADELRCFCRADAEVVLYRPRVRNVFDVASRDRAGRVSRPGHLRLIAVGTIEPRKNLFAAAAILSALRRTSHPEATLDIVGRAGWGVDVARLAGTPGVTVHGYRAAGEVRTLIEFADALISTSHDEGLGLPLLECQYAGLAVIAPDRPVFREVLGMSGIFIDDGGPEAAALRIGQAFIAPDWRLDHTKSAEANLKRWNALSDMDQTRVIQCMSRLGAYDSHRRDKAAFMPLDIPNNG